MKKCLTIALLVFAVAILAIVPASAVAPLIDPLPRVVVGDETAVFEIQQAFEIDDYVDWFHGGTQNAGRKPEAMHVYLSDASGVVNGYNAAGDFPNLIGADLDALIGLGMPDAAFDQDIESGWGTTPDEQFLRWISLKASAAGAVDVDFYAAISAGDLSTTFSVSNLPVNAVAGADDAKQFETKKPITPPDGALVAWQEGAPPGFTGPDGVQAGGMVGWDVGPSLPPVGSFHFATLKPCDEDGKTDFIPNDGGGLTNPVFKASVLLTNNAATTYSEAPGYRLDFFNSAKTHRGFYAVILGSELMGMNYPFLGSDYTASIMWETPQDLTDMGDDGRIAAFQFGLTTDGRDYEIQFDVIDYAGTQGNFGIKELNVMTYEKDEDLAVVPGGVLYDGAAAGPSFDGWFGEPGLDLDDGAGGIISFGDGVFSMTDGSVTFGLGQASPGRFFEKLTPPYDAADNLAVGPNSMVRVNMLVASTSVENTPILRLYNSLRLTFPLSISLAEDWGATMTFGGVKDNGMVEGQPAGAVNPGVPKAEGSELASYMCVANVADGEFIMPQWQTWSAGFYGGPNAWPIDNGSFEFTMVSIDEVE